MSDTKIKPTAAPNQLRTLAQNVRLCADILDLTLETVAKEVKVPVSLLSSFEDGVGVLTPDMLERLAFELRLTKLQLLRAGPLETRRSIFEALLHPERPIEVPDDDLDRSLLRGSKRKETQAGARKGDDDDDAEEDAEASSDESEATTTVPEAEQPEPSEQSTEPVEAPPAPLPVRVSAIDDSVTWVSESRALCDGKSFDLTDMRLRKLLGIRLLSARKPLILSTFGELMVPVRSKSWLHNLKRGAVAPTRDDLEQAAKICEVPLSCLLTGHGLEEAINQKRK